MDKVGPFFMLGVIIYGWVFTPTFTGYNSELRMMSAAVEFQEKPSLGFLDGVHNGFAIPGNVVRSYVVYVYEMIGRGWSRATMPELYMSRTNYCLAMVFGLIKGFIVAILVFMLHILFYIALLFKLFFVGTTPLYHLCLLMGTGVTWLFMAIISVAEKQREAAQAE